jgi:hypothetical protein
VRTVVIRLIGLLLSFGIGGCDSSSHAQQVPKEAQQPYVLVSPYPNLPSSVVASA